ncbi:MAG: efflux RND transporter permease subunit [Chloroflexota bacterium]|nr:efflux RND transporter permease subunit [Chloroflexota bacterium]
MKIWDVAIRQPVFMTMILAAGVVLGVASYLRMPVDIFPDVEYPVIVVTTIYPGAGPEEVEDLVTTTLEEKLSAIGGLDTITSQSSEGVSTVIMQFDMDLSPDQLSQEVREKVDLVRRDLPGGIEEPIITRFSITDSPVIVFGVTDRAGQLSPSELRAKTEDEIQQRVQRVRDVAAVEVAGGEEREIQVLLKMDALQARRIAPQQVKEAIAVENLNIPAGSLRDSRQELLVRTPGNFAIVADIGDVIVTQRGAPVYVRDVADIVDGFKERERITRLNGAESVVVSVRKQSGSNSAAVAAGVKEALDEVIAANPEFEIVIVDDESDVVLRATNGALEDLLWATALAFLVVLLFFRNVRNTIITIIGLPVIIVSTLFFMNLFGISINQLSLLALALAVGFLIDDAIVVRENIMRWIGRGYTPHEASSQATAEVALPVLATSATILAVFLPVAYTEGFIGKLFRDFGLTVSIAVVVSTFEALTMAPMLSAKFFRAKDIEPKTDPERHDDATQEAAHESLMGRIYGRILNWTLTHKLIVAIVAIGVIVASVFAAAAIPQVFLPDLDRGKIDVRMELPVGTPLEATYTEALKVEQILRSHPAVVHVFTTVGQTGAPNKASYSVILDKEGIDRGDWSTRGVIGDLRRPLANVPGISFQVIDEMSAASDLMGSKDMVVELSADSVDYATLGETSLSIMEQMAAIPGVADIESTYKPGTPELQVTIDRRLAGDLGLSTAQIATTLRMLVNGEVASIFRGQGEEAEIVVRLDKSGRSSAEDVLNLNMLSPTGQLIPLSTVAQATIASGPSEIAHVDRRPTVSIGANVSGRSEAETVADVTALLPTLDLSPGVEARLGGIADLQEDSFRNLSLALLLAVIFIYMALASQFGSFVQPLLVMIAMPLAVIGAVLSLAMTNRPLDLTAFIGFIMLMGLVTKNSILLIEFANQARANGATAEEAMRRAGPIRLRPILMTAFSTILAMVPVAIGMGAGGEFRSSMAIAIIGGMTTSTFLTLLMVPTAYSAVVGGLDRLSARRQAAKEAKQARRRLQRTAEESNQSDASNESAAEKAQTAGD